MLYILFDSNSVAWRSRFNHNLNDKHDGIVVKGFLYNVLQMSLRLGNPNVLFAWDTSNAISKRKELFPDYKKRHEEKSDEDLRLDGIARFQMDVLRDQVLPDMGFKNIFFQDGLEGDDIVASLVKDYPDDKFIVISSDKDLWQLIGSNMVQTFIDTDKLYNFDAFKADWGIDPEWWGEVKAIGGCETDKVPGVKGVKEKTAIKYLKHELKETSVKYKSIASDRGQQIIARNKPLVILPFADTKTPVVKQEKLDINVIKKAFKKHKLFDFIKSAMLDKWAEAFKLQLDRDVF